MMHHEWEITPGNKYFPDVLNTQTGFVMRPFHIETEREGKNLTLVKAQGYRVTDGQMDRSVVDVWQWTSESDYAIPRDLLHIVQ